MSLDVYLCGEADLGGPEPHTFQVFEQNITHNLGKMAKQVGIYEALWRPDEIRVKTAADLIARLRHGLDKLTADPERFKQFNPANGWGDYDGLVSFVTEYLAACQEYPKAKVRISR